MTSTPATSSEDYAGALARQLVEGLASGKKTPAPSSTSQPAAGTASSRDVAAPVTDLSAIIEQVMAGVTPAAPAPRAAPGAGPGASPGATPDDGYPAVEADEQQRFFGALLHAVLPVVQHVAPMVLQAIQGRRRDLGLPEQRDPATLERDFGAVFSGLMSQIVPCFAPIVSQLLGQRDVDPENTEQVQQRFFFPLLASLIPAAIQAVPGIVNAISGGRDLNAVELTTDKEAGERFFGSFLPQLASGLFEQLPNIIQAFRPRETKDVPTAVAPDSASANGEEQQRFFGALFQTVLPAVINTVPTILQAIQGQRRDLGLPEERDTETLQRDLGAVLSGILGQVINVLPQIVGQLAGQRDIDPQDSEQVQQRFIFPLLATLIPAAVQAVPGIINAISGGRDLTRALDDDEEARQRFFGGFLPPLITNCWGGINQHLPQLLQTLAGGRKDVGSPEDDEDQQRFFGALLPMLLPTLINAVPTVLEAIQGRRRALGLPEERDPETLQRNIFDSISAFVDEATNVIEHPTEILQMAIHDAASAFRDVDPQNAEEVQQRFFFPLLASLIPAAIQAVPAIVNSISGGRSINAADVVTDEEVGERFFGSFIPQLASGLFHHLPGIIEVLRRRGSRDLPVATAPVATVPGLPGAPQDEQQRFFGGLLQAILPVVVNAVPSVLQAIQGQRRNLGLPDETDATVVERDFSTVLSGLLGKVINVLPQVAETLFSQRDVDPQNGEEVQQRFIFPLLATLIPAAAQAIPAIISAVSGQRDVDESVIDVADKEIAQRFFGPLIGQLASGIVQQLPQIMQVFSPRPREHQLNWINFTGQWLPDHDVVRTVERDLGDPGSVEFQLEQPYGTWWKGLAVWIGGTKVQEVGVQDSRNTSDPIRIPVGDVAGAGWIQLLKAKTFGVHTPMYALTGLDQKAGKHVTFRWEHS